MHLKCFGLKKISNIYFKKLLEHKNYDTLFKRLAIEKIDSLENKSV